jgi:hypothetical protein
MKDEWSFHRKQEGGDVLLDKGTKEEMIVRYMSLPLARRGQHFLMIGRRTFNRREIEQMAGEMGLA